MLLISFVGVSGSGKTTIIKLLTEELKKRGYSVGCIKHCPRGFDMDYPGKDSYMFTEAGADGVILHSPERKGMIKNIDRPSNLEELAIDNFLNLDFVLAEGFSEADNVKKIELLREEVSDNPRVKDSIAILSDFDVISKKIVFKNNDIGGIIDYLENLNQNKEKITRVKVNGKNLKINDFVKEFTKNIILGILKSLKRENEEIKRIDIKMEV